MKSFFDLYDVGTKNIISLHGSPRHNLSIHTSSFSCNGRKQICPMKQHTMSEWLYSQYLIFSSDCHHVSYINRKSIYLTIIIKN